jgi:hypothetical protein
LIEELGQSDFIVKVKDLFYYRGGFIYPKVKGRYSWGKTTITITGNTKNVENRLKRNRVKGLDWSRKEWNRIEKNRTSE